MRAIGKVIVANVRIEFLDGVCICRTVLVASKFLIHVNHHTSGRKKLLQFHYGKLLYCAAQIYGKRSGSTGYLPRKHTARNVAHNFPADASRGNNSSGSEKIGKMAVYNSSIGKLVDSGR